MKIYTIFGISLAGVIIVTAIVGALTMMCCNPMKDGEGYEQIEEKSKSKSDKDKKSSSKDRKDRDRSRSKKDDGVNIL